MRQLLARAFQQRHKKIKQVAGANREGIASVRMHASSMADIQAHIDAVAAEVNVKRTRLLPNNPPGVRIASTFALTSLSSYFGASSVMGMDLFCSQPVASASNRRPTPCVCGAEHMGAQ